MRVYHDPELESHPPLRLLRVSSCVNMPVIVDVPTHALPRPCASPPPLPRGPSQPVTQSSRRGSPAVTPTARQPSLAFPVPAHMLHAPPLHRPASRWSRLRPRGARAAPHATASRPTHDGRVARVSTLVSRCDLTREDSPLCSRRGPEPADGDPKRRACQHLIVVPAPQTPRSEEWCGRSTPCGRGERPRHDHATRGTADVRYEAIDSEKRPGPTRTLPCNMHRGQVTGHYRRRAPTFGANKDL